MTSHRTPGPQDGRLRDPARNGGADSDSAEKVAFQQLTREMKAIKLHCYRIMGSLSDAEDMTQETFARAWSARGDLADLSSARPWLYRIATNACLDALRRRKRERRLWFDPAPVPTGDFAELGKPDLDVPWLEPIPDAFLADERSNPHAIYEQAEAVRLAFLACLQLLPARQRAVFLLLDVLGWSAAEAASTLAVTPQAANSLLQRARRTFHAAYEREPKWAPASDQEWQVAERYATALETRDLDGFVSLLHADVSLRMPPWRAWLRGRDLVRRFMGQGWARWGGFRTLVFRANGRSAVLTYACTAEIPDWRPHSMHVLEVSEGAIASVMAFVGPTAPALFANAGLPSYPEAFAQTE